MIEILPAIDLKNAEVVRLTQGDYDRVKIYETDPLAVAERFIADGMNWLHIVDLDAALKGHAVNFETIQSLGNFLQKHHKHFEIGGGIRQFETLRDYIETAGASRVILGTVAYEDPNFVRLAASEYPGKIAVGVDLKKGRIATRGWTESLDQPLTDFLKRIEDCGVSCVVYTDVHRDGMLSGLNFEGIANFASLCTLPVIVAGGLRDITDLEKLTAMHRPNVIGAITGKAVYEGTLNLKEALCWLKESSLV